MILIAQKDFNCCEFDFSILPWNILDRYRIDLDVKIVIREYIKVWRNLKILIALKGFSILELPVSFRSVRNSIIKEFKSVNISII